jgi:hypothetical protein
MCEERYRLVNQYAASAATLSKAAQKLRGLHGEEFSQARIEFGAARSECNIARESLLRHETDHEGCSEPQRHRAEARAACG